MSGLKFGTPNLGNISRNAYIQFSTVLLEGGQLNGKPVEAQFHKVSGGTKRRTMRLVRQVARDNATKVVVSIEDNDGVIIEEEADKNNTQINVSVDKLDDKREVNIAYPEENPGPTADYLEKYVKVVCELALGTGNINYSPAGLKDAQKFLFGVMLLTRCM